MVDWDLIGFIKASQYRLSILRSLEKRQKTPSELRSELNLYISHVSKTLKELVDRNLVECLTSKLKKGKIFTITEEGRALMAQINK